MKLNIRFQHWVLGATLALVIFSTAIFLASILSSFNATAERTAREQFALIARQASAEIVGLVKGVGRFVAMESKLESGFFADQSGTGSVASTLMNSLAGDENLYGHYFGLKNDDFLQVIAVRQHPKLIESLKAPEGTWFGVRRIFQAPGAERLEHWEFLGPDRQVLGQRQEAAAYQPTTRPWFAGALAKGGITMTSPYVFASTGALGLTVSQPLANQIGVFGTDIDLSALQAYLDKLSLSANGAILLLDDQKRVVGYSGRGEVFGKLGVKPLTDIGAVDSPLLRALAGPVAGEPSQVAELQAGQRYVVISQDAEIFPGTHFTVLALAPMSDFTAPVDQARNQVLLVTGLILVLLLPLAMLGSRQVVRALSQLARNSEKLKHLDFSGDPVVPESFLYEINALGEAQVVMHHSVKERAEELAVAQEKLSLLVENSLMMAREQDRGKLLRHILDSGRAIAHCAAGTLYLKTERNTLSFAVRTNDMELPKFEVPLYHTDTGEPMTGFVSSYVALHNETVIIDDVYSETRFDLSGTKRFSEESGFRTISMLTVPLSPREGEVIGVMQLMNALDPATGEVVPFARDIVGFVEAMAGQSAVTLENLNLLEAQKVLMDSMIKIIAGAIDAKSPYTGGHCERVPQLAMMLAEEAQKVSEGPLADFGFKNADEWNEFRLGAWLHDCGKVTTPEYVVDKATKLETIYNRIHEVRTRFEVLLRDADIARLEAIVAGTPAAEADAAFAARKQELLDDFAFIAESNIGGEFMAPELVERVKKIGTQTWMRHFDDRVGLSHEELRRFEGIPAAPLPAVEHLLSDKPWHILKRTDMRALDPKYGFKIKVPDNLYNFGEIYNLSIARGTLTEEERFKINEHIIQTIVMLDNMPFPKNLRRVPEYAGTHHETLIGSGYPRKLTQAELSVPARIMAIADIFEALTACDRPYKKAKTLSESVKILSFFRNDKHIDPVLFDLFLTSGVYMRYARRFLTPEQIDEVDISKFLSKPPVADRQEQAPA